MADDLPTFDEMYSFLCDQLYMAYDAYPATFQKITDLMKPRYPQLPDTFVFEAFGLLKADGLLYPGSALVGGGDAQVLLSSEGRAYLRQLGRTPDDDEDELS